MASPFDFVNSVTYGKNDMIKDGECAENDYEPFIVNKSLSYMLDTILHANEMNIYFNLPKYVQYRYFLGAITKKKRYAKWAKKEIKSEDFILVQNHYNLNDQRTREYLKILSVDQIEHLRIINNKGGR